MGNLCGKESPADPFSQPGRTVSSTPPPTTNKTAPLPRKVGGPPRTLGSSSSPQTSAEQADARNKAAEAAEARANSAKNKPTGKLGAQLQEQKKQTRTDTLEAVSKEERMRRDADSNAETRAYN